MSRLTLRTLVLGPVLTAAAVGPLVTAAFIHRSVRADLVATVDAEVRRANAVPNLPPMSAGSGSPAVIAAPSATADLAKDGSKALPRQLDEAIAPRNLLLDRQGRVLEGDSTGFSDAELAGLLAQPGRIATIGAAPKFRAAAAARSGRYLVSALPLDDVDATMSRLRRALIVAGGALFAIQAAAVLWALRFVVRPLQDMSSAAERIAAGDTATAIPHRRGTRETHTLASSLAEMVGQLHQRLVERDRSVADAETARDAMSAMIANIAHELRTPLTALAGYSQLHARGMLDEASRDRAMGRIGAEAIRLSSLVDSVVDLARHGAHQPAERAVFDVAELVSEVAHDLQAAFPLRAFTVAVPPGPVTVEADRAGIQQVLVNLGANAAVHTAPADGPIELAVSQHPGSVTFAVVDHGPGIPSDLVSRVFEPFFRADKARARVRDSTTAANAANAASAAATAGAGLGLSIARAIADQHEGRLEHSPTLGGGTTMTLSLPVAPDTLPGVTSSAPRTGGRLNVAHQ